MRRFILLIEVLGAAAFAGLQALHLYEEYKRTKRRQELDALEPVTFEAVDPMPDSLARIAASLESIEASLKKEPSKTPS